MDKLQVDRTQQQLNTPSSSSATTPTSRPASRRTSTIIPRESLPTPPPDPRESITTTPLRRTSQTENIFVYPPTKKDLPIEFQGLLKYGERQEEFQKMLNKTIANDCKNFHKNFPTSNTSPKGEEPGKTQHQCQCCDRLRKDCDDSIEPLRYRLNSTITAALAAYGAIEQLNRMYSMWDQYLTMEKELRQRKECLQYVRLLESKSEEPKSWDKHNSLAAENEIDHQDMEESIALLETILKPEQLGNQHQQHLRTPDPKQQRERSKSCMIEDMSSMREERDASKSNNTGHLLRRQSTYSDSKSKVSKWTKVKAAFKWEKANVPALMEGSRDSIGLTPNNTEVARYLRVPSLPCGTSSADSVLSSSSGHLLSDAGTPGTISSASSMDDIDNACCMRRDSSKSDILENQGDRTGSQQLQCETKSQDGLSSNTTVSTMVVDNNGAGGVGIGAGITSKSSSNKSLRKCKLMSDFEVLPEDVEAIIPAGSKRKNRNPPSPLNLNLQQDLNDPDHHYYASPHLLKASPQDGTQSLNRTLKKISSPVNSSVPSSPSRHSDFFAEFECEDISSGDFSEPNSPNHLTSRKSYEQQKDEVNRRYQVLRAKLDKEFENKRKEWQKLKSNRAMALVANPRPAAAEPLSPNPSTMSSNISAKLLEENLTPDFKKKLQKWRVKKQASIGGIQPAAPMSPTISKDANAKIDWHLWKTGQLKLDGQGLSPLPDQKDLPEDFQKKLEQWNKIKRGGSATSCTDSLKRTHKHGGSAKKGESDDDRVVDKDKRLEKHKPHDKEKSERLAKLKAIVGEHPAKEIEVKTSAGVMKFEGISRKFTRKLYEWEKARGIGPESSTFALLHPGYCPIDVKRISKESHNHENSPTLSRSLSLDSISPSIALPVISQQASSLSLNDVNELKEIEGVVSSTDALTMDSDYKKFDEPEAVMVEVEDHIVETASPLKLIPPLDKKQTPIYKYEEKTCKDFCNSRKVQSFESHTNLAPLLNVLKNSEELLKLLKQKSPEIGENEKLHLCDGVLAFIRSSYSYYADNLMKPNVLNAISDVQNELCRLRNLCIKSPLDEACCQEIMEERNLEYDEEIQGLHETLEILKQNIQGGYPRLSKDIVPDINIITDETSNIAAAVQATATNDVLSTTLEATDELSTSVIENEIKPKQLSNSNGIGVLAVNSLGGGNNSVGSAGGAKKKVRLRKMGSRQNSKTESDSSDEDNNHSILETPRRLKRKNYRFKQRSFDEDANSSTIAEDMVYVLKVKPGQPIQQICDAGNSSRVLESYGGGGVPSNATFAQLPLATSTSLPNVFVKTKRKVFTAVQEPMAIDGVAVIEQEILHSPTEVAQNSIPSVEKPEYRTSKEPTIVTSEQRESFIRDLEIELKPRVMLVHKSISLDDVRSDIEYDELRKVHSAQNLNSNKNRTDVKENKGFRLPLASDSFRLLNRNRESPIKVDNITKCQNLLHYTKNKKDHLYRKNNDKQYSANALHFKGATIKKIENKIAKTHSGSSVSDTDFTKFLTPSAQKLDNTVPRIARKWERHSLTPTSQHIKFDYPSPNISEPTSPVFEQTSRPMTPLSERALRIQKAKEEFLREKPRCLTVVKLRENLQRDANWGEKRQSDLSLSSTTADEGSVHCEEALESEDNELHKSLSADTIRAESPPTQSDTGTDQDFGGIYDSIPRQVTRSGKISSKLGFATLASKLRRVKGKKAKDNSHSPLASNHPASKSGSALTALCRQTIFNDIIVAPQMVSSASEMENKVLLPTESVKKSQSSPHAMLRSPNNTNNNTNNNAIAADFSRLNKSHSEQYVKRHKESYV